jgi:lipoprotein-anchoring transpeptidase ErfK/SrfK
MKAPAYISYCLLTFITHCLTALLFVAVVTAANTTRQQTTLTKAQKQQAEPKRRAAPLTVDEIEEARALLSKLGYWLDEQAKGRDASLRHALIAFQKIEDRKRTGVLTKAELEALRTARPPLPQEEGYPHIEVDLQLQVLFVVECDDVPLRILPISSGSGELFTEGGVTRRAITPTGRFKVTRKIEGWRKSPLGLLYYPNYIYDGIAIHGNPSVPTRPASHGCIRIPMFAAEEFSQIAVIGTEVIVYDDIIP